MMNKCVCVFNNSNKTELRHFIEDCELNRINLIRPFVDGDVSCTVTTVFFLEFQNLVDLIDTSLNCATQNNI